MKRMIKVVTMAMTLTMAVSGIALATPSTQIFIPSTDIQAFGTGHLGIDNYIRTSNKGGFPNYYDVGVTAGVLPFEKIQAEVGVDYFEGGQGGFGVDADKHPIYFNAKLGTPEDSLFKYSPALAVGIWNLGTANSAKQNIIYGLAARTLPVVGRISAGGYHGAKSVLGQGQNDGALVSWDRTMSEINDKLWLAVDYMSGNNFNGSLNFGVSWAFTKNISVIVGYDIYNNPNTGGKNTFNTQLDINFP
jgi:hypothetical protein